MTSNDSPFRAAIITMVYNEKRNLPLWYRYYGAQLGYENLYVIDHGSTDGSVDAKICNQIRLPRTPYDENVRAEMVSDFHRGLLRYFDVVIYTDCDEFIVPRPSKFGNLMDFLRNRSEETTRCIGINVVQHSMTEPPLDLGMSVLRQRPYGAAIHWEAKPLIASIPIRWHAGFHNCDQRSILNSDAWLFHMKYADVSSNLERLATTRSIEWSEQALTTRQSASHRVADEEMLRTIKEMQNSITEDSLDDLDFGTVFSSRGASNVRRIPQEFLDSL